MVKVNYKYENGCKLLLQRKMQRKRKWNLEVKWKMELKRSPYEIDQPIQGF